MRKKWFDCSKRMVKVQEITDKKTWGEFLVLAKTEFTPFFQSWNWGRVMEAVGNSVYRLGVYKNKKLVGICQIVLVRARRGNYLHLRHGPVLTNFKQDFDTFFRNVQSLAEELRVDFIRTSPLLGQSDHTFFQKRGFRNAPIHNMDAENTWVLDLYQSEEELLSGMRKTTRYLVRKALELPISVKMSVDEKDFVKFMKLYEETSRRHGFVLQRNIEEEFIILTKAKQAKLFLAEYKKHIIAASLVVFYGNQAVYHHAALDYRYKNIPAAYLLAWEAIREAKRMRKKLYNFWGVVSPEKLKHPWQGLTLFKTGFGGRRINFIHAQDFPLTPLYWKTFLIESATKLLKGY